jgi:hypothetical protein
LLNELPPSSSTSLLPDEKPSAKDEAIEALQRSLDAERDARKEERFILLVALVLVFDAFTFQQMQTWSGPLLIGFIQVLVIIALGRRWGIDYIWILTEKLIDKWDGRLKGGGE